MELRSLSTFIRTGPLHRASRTAGRTGQSREDGERAVERTYNDERPLLLEALGKRFATPEDGDSLYVVTTYGKFPIADGKTIGEIAHTLGVSMAEAVLEVTRQTGARATCVSFSMCEDDVRTMLAQNDFAIGSDGRGFSLDPRECDGKPHPRNFGTFPGSCA